MTLISVQCELARAKGLFLSSSFRGSERRREFRLVDNYGELASYCVVDHLNSSVRAGSGSSVVGCVQFGSAAPVGSAAFRALLASVGGGMDDGTVHCIV